jgi:hypothetical protein
MLYSSSWTGERKTVVDEKIKALEGQIDFIFLISGNNIQDVQKILPNRIICYPVVAFSAYHPDLVFLTHKSTGGNFGAGPVGEYNSWIAAWSFFHGLSVSDALKLYRSEVFEAIGYYDFLPESDRFMLSQLETVGWPESLLRKWAAQGVFMHSVNHPKITVLRDIAACLLQKAGLEVKPDWQVTEIADYLADDARWPVYPPIAQHLGVPVGPMDFFVPKRLVRERGCASVFGLEEFVSRSFDAFARYREDLNCARLDMPQYGIPAKFITGASTFRSRAEKDVTSPYSGLPPYCYWRPSIANVSPSEVDPVIRVPFKINPQTKVATAGSCFAQHISRTLVTSGFNYLVSEAGGCLPVDEANRRNFGVFSARFGNIYTSLQLLQLFDRAYSLYSPQDVTWERIDGRFADPFRPQIEPDGFETKADLVTDRERHFLCVRNMFENAEVFIFTMGLTEAWRRKADGAVFPLAPGVAAGRFDAKLYEFVNFGVQEVVDHMNQFMIKLRSVNPRVKTILTVSPVPLIATYEQQHVLLSTTLSKAVLRVAAETVTSTFENCFYFPSYEVITSSFSRGRYFDTDLRSVTDVGVAHVMRLFTKHLLEGAPRIEPRNSSLSELGALSRMVCDEEALDPTH